MPLAEEIDFRQMFKFAPTAMALLTSDLFFIDANDQWIETCGSGLHELIGHNFFEIFPKSPGTDRQGDTRWTALEEAVTTGRRVAKSLVRYDFDAPEHPGMFEEHYWSVVCVPIRRIGGEIDVLEVSLRDVTPVINEYRRWQHQGEQSGDVGLAR